MMKTKTTIEEVPTKVITKIGSQRRGIVGVVEVVISVVVMIEGQLDISQEP